MNTNPMHSSYADWVGRTQTRGDQVSLASTVAMAATLDLDASAISAGSPLPPLWHWTCFRPDDRQSELGPDGHGKRGGFLPPVPLPRRMWAGGRLHFHAALRVAEEIERRSTVRAIHPKQGASGPLVFVTVRHEIHGPRGLAIEEEHDIVYREAPAPGASTPPPTRAPVDDDFSRTLQADPVLLFRYSALTFNGHRIHYDRSYTTEVEGYPGLVVHGPLIATLLLDLLARQRKPPTVKAFEFKALRPIFDIHPFSVHGHDAGLGIFSLWARDHEGHLAMKATAHAA
jgi:3-methylfumaryl-CoA hydratase